MQIRAVYFLSAASVALAATLLVPGSSAQAAECLAAPKGAAPAGSHWRYRTDHAAKKNCWYLKAETKSAAPAETADASDSGAEASAAPAPAPAKPAAAPIAAQNRAPTRSAQMPEQALQPAVANARAEIEAPAQQQPSAQPAATSAAPDTAFPAPMPMQSGDPTATQANPSSPIDQRWSDTAGGNQQTGDAAVAARLRSNAQEAAARTSADSTSAVSGQSTTTLILALLAALALAGVIVGAIVRFSGSEPIVQRRSRRDIWGDADVDPAPELPLDLGQPPRWIQAARQHQAPVNDADEIENLLARAKIDDRLAAHHPN